MRSKRYVSRSDRLQPKEFGRNSDHNGSHRSRCFAGIETGLTWTSLDPSRVKDNLTRLAASHEIHALLKVSQVKAVRYDRLEIQTT